MIVSIHMTVPQLRMGFTRFDALTAPQPVSGYGLRTFRPSDEAAWLDVLSTVEDWGWNNDRIKLDRMIEGERAHLPHEGIWFATKDDVPVAAACGFCYPDAGELGWVVTHPDHQSHGLAVQICRATLLLLRQRGYRYAYLTTEDHRAKAIRMYLKLGFEPEMVDACHPAWWETFRREHKV